MYADPLAPGAYRGLFDLSGRTALVTGGAGILGRHFAAALADAGAQVVIVDLAGAEEIAARLEWYAGPVHARTVDLADPDAVTELVGEVEATVGSIDILLNNAATKGSDLAEFFASVEDYSLDTWRVIMSINLDAAFHVARTVGSRMAVRGNGSIVQTASIYGICGPDQRIYEGSEYMGRPINTPAVYSASKAGIVGLTRHLATYWASAGVRVNTLTPGGVSSGQNEAFDRRYSDKVPLGRMGRPDDLTGAILFLASDASRYVTGQNLVVDGGWSVW